MASTRRALLVLGMHRSGTSALTRVLSIHGASLPNDLLPANSGNITGYWESQPLVHFHDHVLEAAGSDWDSPVWFSRPGLSPPRVRELAQQLAELIESEFGASAFFVVKDPRLCRLVELWTAALALLEIEPLPVLISRHPMEVAASLSRRDGTPARVGLLLWLQYVLAAEFGTRPMRRAVVSYAQLLDDCPSAMERIQRQLGVRFPDPSPEAVRDAAAFIQPGLRHESTPTPDWQLLPEVPPWIAETHRWFEQACNQEQPSTEPLDKVRAELAEAERLFEPALVWSQTTRRQRSRQAAAEADADAERADALDSQRAAADAQRREDALLADIRQLQSDLAAATVHIEAAAARAQSREDALLSEIRQVQSDLAAATVHIEALHAQVQVMDAALSRTESGLAFWRERARQMQGTLRWRAGDWCRRLMFLSMDQPPQ